ncbi:Beta-galactosidase [Streptomyces alboniger]
MYEHREIAAPVRLRRLDSGDVLITNHQHFRDLTWLTGEWRLETPDAAAVRAPARLPHLGPGESASLPVPAELLARLPEAADGEAWLTLRVRTAADQVWAPRGTEVCVPQVRLRREARGLLARATVREERSAAPVCVDDLGFLVHPRLAAPPVLSLWRAPTDNDRLGRAADRWAEQGLASAARSLTDIKRDGERVVVRAEYFTAAGPVLHEQVLTALAAGVLLVEETAMIPEGLDDLPRVGTVFTAAAGLDRAEWFGHGPGETYPDRYAGGPVGHYGAPVRELFTPYVRPQESGGRHGVRWFSLTAGDGNGLTVHLDTPRQVQLTHFTAADLAAARHHDELIPRPCVTVHLDAVHRATGHRLLRPGHPARLPGGSGDLPMGVDSARRGGTRHEPPTRAARPADGHESRWCGAGLRRRDCVRADILVSPLMRPWWTAGLTTPRHNAPAGPSRGAQPRKPSMPCRVEPCADGDAAEAAVSGLGSGSFAQTASASP